MHFSKKCDTIPYDLIAYYAILEKRKDILVKMIGEYILLALLLASALFIVIAVTLQKSGDEGLSSTIAGGSDTYYGKDKSQNKEKFLAKWTLIITIVFALAVLVVYVIQPDYTASTDMYGSKIDYDSWQQFAGEYSSAFKK